MMLDRFQTRRLRVFSHLNEWFEEFRLYHRKDGLIVKIDDDLMAATRYGLMMLRKAKTCTRCSRHDRISWHPWTPRPSGCSTRLRGTEQT